MTRIEFHFNTTERLQYACRLLRKAHARDLRVGVLGSEATLRQLYRLNRLSGRSILQPGQVLRIDP